MNAAIVIGLFALLAAGLTLLVLGLRGRRINDHPICRGCGFDLVGVLPSGTTCPECGAGVKSSRWVRIGARKKRVTWIIAGVVLTAGAAVPIGAGVLVLASGVQIIKHKPLALLAWEASRGSDETRGMIGAEIERRMLANLLDAGQAERAAELALEMQADINRAWQPVWARVFEQARLANAATPTQIERFESQSVVPGLLVRPVVRAGDPLPFHVTVKEYRGVELPSLNARYQATVAAITLNGTDLSLHDSSARRSTATFIMSPPQDGSVSMTQMRASVRTTADTPPGLQTLSFKVNVSRAVFWTGGPQTAKPSERSLKLTADVDVVSTRTAATQAIELPDEYAEKLTELMRRSGLYQRFQGDEHGWTRGLAIPSEWQQADETLTEAQLAELPVIFAELESVEPDGTTQPLGSIHNEMVVQTTSTRAMPFWNHQSASPLTKSPAKGPTVSIRFRFDPEKANTLIRVGRPVKGELVVTGVPVTFMTNRNMRANTLEEWKALNEMPPKP